MVGGQVANTDSLMPEWKRGRPSWRPLRFCGRSVSRIPGADGTSIWIHVSGGAVVVALSAVGIGLLMRLHIGAGVRGVPSWELLV